MKNTKIDKAVLEMRVDASAGRGMAGEPENCAHCYAHIVGAQAHTRR